MSYFFHQLHIQDMKWITFIQFLMTHGVMCHSLSCTAYTALGGGGGGGGLSHMSQDWPSAAGFSMDLNG